MFRVEKCGEVLYNGRYNHIVKGYDRFMKRILIVEDDKGLNDGLVYDLREEGYEVSSALTAMRAMETFRLQEPDLVLMDVNLPDSDGFALCSQMKRLRDVPVIFLTARDLEQDEMRGFDCGADDYMTKPFSMALLHKRIRAVLKRSGRGREQNFYSDGHLTADFDRADVTLDGKPLTLTPTEYKLMKLFIDHRGRVLTRQMILEKLWDANGNYVDEHALTVNIGRLRRKVEQDGNKYIKTIYGMGYMWEVRDA